MKNYYVIKMNRNTDKPELIEVMKMNSLKEAKIAAGRKYVSYAIDIEIGLAIVSKDTFKEYWEKKIERTQEDKENKEDKEMTNKREVLNNMTVKELRAEAKAHGIEGMSRAKKEELIAALMFHNYGQPDPEEHTTKINKVTMYAFTGMVIGEFVAEDDGEHILVYTESRGELMFDRETGKEITDPKKARYANRVERA